MEVFGRCDFWMNKIAFAVVDFVLFLLSQEAEVLKRKKIMILLFVTLQWIFISFCNVNFYAVELQSTLQASLMSALYLGRFLSGNVFFFILRCSSDLTGIYVCEKNSCTDGSCVINKLTGLFKEGCAFIPERNQTAVSSIMYMQSLSSVSTNMWEQISFNETYRYKNLIYPPMLHLVQLLCKQINCNVLLWMRYEVNCEVMSQLCVYKNHLLWFSISNLFITLLLLTSDFYLPVLNTLGGRIL